MEFRLDAFALVFPGTHVHEVLVITLGLAFLGLHFLAEVTAAGFLAVKGVAGHQLADVEEVDQTERLLEFLVELLVRSGDADGLPELFAERADFLDSLLQAGLVAGHAHILPHDVAEFLVDAVHGLGTLDGEYLLNPLADGLLGLGELGSVDVGLGLRKLMGQIVADGVREDKVTVSQALHKGGGTETVAAVVGEVSFADGVEARDGGLEIIVNPEEEVIFSYIWKRLP